MPTDNNTDRNNFDSIEEYYAHKIASEQIDYDPKAARKKLFWTIVIAAAILWIILRQF